MMRENGVGPNGTESPGGYLAEDDEDAQVSADQCQWEMSVRTKMTQNDSDTSNDMSHEDVCPRAWKRVQSG